MFLVIARLQYRRHEHQQRRKSKKNEKNNKNPFFYFNLHEFKTAICSKGNS